jgi:iron complex transport system substrate-binding protein
VRPAQARKEKPKISAFTSAKIEEILKLKPDLAIGFSDMQADIAQSLIRHGVEVWISNHRSVEGIVGYVRRLGALVGATDKTENVRRANSNSTGIASNAPPRDSRAARESISRNGTSRKSARYVGSVSW